VVTALDVPGKPKAEVKELGPDDVFSILLDPGRTFEDFGDDRVHAAAADGFGRDGLLPKGTARWASTRTCASTAKK
jgi:hypothetical protein